jgi:SPX domain protein involved in polyphosphate accumulation
MRYERKFYQQNLPDLQAEILVKRIPYCFKEIYWRRQVNNIYWDKINFKFYKDSINGIHERKKIRLRWYNHLEDIKTASIEVKRKNGHVGSKRHIKNKFSELIKYLKSLNLVSTLANTYKRRYFQTLDKKIRITVDTELAFYKTDFIKILPNTKICKNGTIIELKYEPENFQVAQQVCKYLPFRLTQFSKYCTGIDMLKK